MAPYIVRTRYEHKSDFIYLNDLSIDDFLNQCKYFNSNNKYIQVMHIKKKFILQKKQAKQHSILKVSKHTSECHCTTLQLQERNLPKSLIIFQNVVLLKSI